MALRRIPAPDLFKTTVRQPLVELPQKGHCYISFRAGIATKKDGKLSADKRKGQVAIVRSDSGGVVLQWYERTFPGEDPEQFTLAAEAEMEELLPELGVTFEWFKRDKRVLKATYKQRPDQALFFWLQEPDSSKDDELLLRCNKAVHGRQWQPDGSALAAPSGTAGAAGGSAAAGPAGAGGPAQSQQNMDALRQLLQAMQQQGDPVAFEDVLGAPRLELLLQQPGVAERLSPLLPDGRQDAAELQATARSAQLWQQMRALSAGIRASRIDATQFGVQPAQPGVSAFLQAVQQQVDTQRQDHKQAWKQQPPTAAGAERQETPAPDATGNALGTAEEQQDQGTNAAQVHRAGNDQADDSHMKEG